MSQTTSKHPKGTKGGKGGKGGKGRGKGTGWQPPGRRRGGAPLLWGLAVLVCILAVAAVALTRNGDKQAARPRSETAPVTVGGTPLPAFPESASAADPAVGKAAPGLRGTNFDGKPVVISADGKPKLVMFVAHWCPHCQREVPLVAKWLKGGGAPAGVQLYSVATGTSPQQPNYPPSAWLAREGWPPPVLTDDANSTAAQAYGLTSYPYFVFIDAGGKVVKRMAGEQPVSTLQAELAAIAKPGT